MTEKRTSNQRTRRWTLEKWCTLKPHRIQIYIIKSTPFNLYRTTIRKIILNYETFHAVISTLSFFHSRFVFFFFCSFVVVAKLKRNKINIFTSWTQLETKFTIFILNKERILLRTFFFLWVDQKRKFIL